MAGGPVSADPPKTLHSFCARPSCADGILPSENLLRGNDGTIYGTTVQGGAGNSGVVFALIPNGKRFSFQLLHTFCELTNCPDGASPITTLILDDAGDLYGTASNGGAHSGGLVFELKPNADRSKYAFVDLYDFASQAGLSDGAQPQGPLTYAGADSGAPYHGVSPLFGTTSSGGANDVGIAFELTHVSGQAQRDLTVLHNFCSRAGCADGSSPNGLIIDADGNLYGTTGSGGKGNGGVLFRLNAANSFTETVLHAFCSLPNCADGRNPVGTPARNLNGVLFGTTVFGGDNNGGVLYKLALNGSETVLYSLCSVGGCADGDEPNAPVILGGHGAIYGTTSLGGTNSFSGGTIFEFDSTGFHSLYSFCALSGCADGASPSGIILVGSSTLFGITGNGGAQNDGTAYRLKVVSP
jgi:uncharacterized repeat protein (TIGR03803 family)